MTQLSNLYASEVFAEHPIALYPLDDGADYVSLINNEQRLFNSGGWSDTFGNVIFSDDPTLPLLSSPFKSNIYTEIIGEVPEEGSGEVTYEIQSPVLFELRDLNEDLATFSISMFFYQSSFFINWYEIGYTYYDQVLEQNKEIVSRVEAGEGREWINFDFSFLPHDYDSSQIKLVIRINAREGGEQEDYNFIVNGLCVGQWSETFSTQSLGVIPENGNFGFPGVPATEYGIQEESGYYLVENNVLLAKNQGLPLVYGSKSTTKIYPSESEGFPSIVFPGKGFLNEAGKQNNYTFEFWMNIEPNTKKEKRIFGPIDSTDGIYVNEGIISLVIGSEFGSHNISEWYRPMLVDISLSSDDASLFINGERVVSIPYNRNSISFPAENDWLGFYSYKNINYFGIDCVAIYPYNVGQDVAKRRFVYGQGTPSPENIAESFDGFNSYINFSNANYGVNKIYPDLALWNSGYNNNLNVTRTSINMPEYQLPQIFVEGREVQELYDDNKIVNELEEEQFFTFRPNVINGKFVANGSKWTENSYLFFENLGFVEDLSAIYGVFATKDIISRSPLMTLTNSFSQDELEAYIENGNIYYAFNGEVLTVNPIEDEEPGSGYGYGNANPNPTINMDGYEPPEDWEYPFAFGFKIKELINTFGYKLNRFFRSTNDLQAYFGGNGETTFNQKIYSIGFSNSLNVKEIDNYFLEDGIIDNFEYEDIVNHIGTYTLSPFIRFNQFFLDISVSSLWEENFPLANFASFVDDYEGNKYYDLDFLQINLGYPSVFDVLDKLRNQFGWNYAELFLEFNSPAQKPYAILDIPEISGYTIYEDLNTKNVIETFLDTSEASMKTFLTFQLLSDGANRPLEDFPFSRELVDTRFIDPNLEFSKPTPNRPILTKYEFLDKTVVYPPSGFDFNSLAIVFHFIIKHRGIFSNPLIVRDFEIVSRSLNHNEFTAIGSESGFPFYSYVKAGIYFENKTQNPTRVSKKRYPYLYLTEDAGLSVLGKPTVSKEYGVAMPINEGKANEYLVSAIQAWLKYDFRQFSAIAQPIFEIQSLDKTIEFLIRSDASGERGTIVARDKRTRVIENNVTFYQNGNRVKTAIVEKNEWFAIGITFDEELIFNNYTGYINFFRGITFNNVSNYRPSGLGKTLEIIARPWRRVLTSNDVDNFTWAVWYVKDETETRMRTNLCYNPNFELNTEGWEPTGSGTTIETISTDSRFGTSSLKCTTGTDNNSGAVFANQSGERMPVTPLTEYAVSAYVKIPEGSPNKAIRMRSRQYSDVTGGFVVSIQNYQSVGITSENGWVRIFFTLTTTSEANALSFEISQASGNEDGSVFYIDSVLVENVTNLFPVVGRYFDGNLGAPGLLAEQFVWSGTPNNSTSMVVYYVPIENQVRQWNSVYALTEQIVFSLNPRDVYLAFIGKNGVVLDDGTILTIDADRLVALSSVNWSRFSDRPA
jgi:hypothetical protein